PQCDDNSTHNLWGVSGRSHTRNCVEFRDMPHTQTGETLCIQLQHFGAGVALHIASISRQRDSKPFGMRLGRNMAASRTACRTPFFSYAESAYNPPERRLTADFRHL